MDGAFLQVNVIQKQNFVMVIKVVNVFSEEVNLMENWHPTGKILNDIEI